MDQKKLLGKKKMPRLGSIFQWMCGAFNCFAQTKYVFCVKVKTLWFCIIMLKHDFQQLTYMLQLLDPHVMATLERSHGEDYFTVLK